MLAIVNGFKEGELDLDANVVFVGADVDNICHVIVPLTETEQTFLTSEVIALRRKVTNLENVFTEKIADIEKICKNVNSNTKSVNASMQNKQANVKANYANATIPNYAKAASSNTSSKPQKTAAANVNHPLSTSGKEWETVVRKKPKSRPMTIGTAESNEIKTVPAIKVSSVFVTRCDPNTKTEDLHSFLSKKTWRINLVEKLKTKFETYASFRIDIVRIDMTESELLKPEHWPTNLLVKRFNRLNIGALRLGSFK
jgi:hypothetical protein